MERQYSSFFLDDRMFGINILLIKEINRHLDIVPVAGAPEFVCGLLNLRGQIITVVDLGVRFSLQPRTITPRSRCIVLKTAGELLHLKNNCLLDEASRDPVGLLVDGIGDMIQAADEEVDRPPANINNLESRFISGIIRSDENLMITLNIKEILDL